MTQIYFLNLCHLCHPLWILFLISKQLINQYYNQLAKIIRFGGSRNETSVRTAFINLINSYAEKKNLLLVTELDTKGRHGNLIRPDGILKNALRLDFGYWESKDEKDDLDREIQAKIRKGYPLTNILFEDSQTAALFQEGAEVMRVPMTDAQQLDAILLRFTGYENSQIRDFTAALEKFKTDIPDIVAQLRALMETEAHQNQAYRTARARFFALCQAEINPAIALEDVREMMIQHILTEDIFNAVFDETGFHRANNIAQELEAVIATFMTRAVKKNFLGHISHYYQTIRDAAAGIADHHEKQKFLKVVYENFYKVYNPKGADRLGVVYTPNEIVRFMVETTDYLLEKHFGKNLHDRNVEILDPATGTGTFITEIIDYLAPQYLKYKYENEIHANEVAILPYYVANLNIEYTYQQKMGEYVEFPNICFVDTLDNTGALDYLHKQDMLFGLSSENAARIQRQNERRISVIIGNPPYNANQANFNDFNRNRDYQEIDRRIKDTFVKQSTAQKTKVYDMYARFFRWAMDRIDRNGVIAFVVNRSFIDSRTFDGFRKCLAADFDHAYIVDTKSDVRANPKIAGTTHNVFGIQTGVAIMFLVKVAGTASKVARIHYASLEDNWRKEEKLAWLRDNPLRSIEFDLITPDAKNNWLNLADTDFDELLPLADKAVKLGHATEGAVFELFTNGVCTNRDEWIGDFDKLNLTGKAKYLSSVYNESLEKQQIYETIKWSRDLRNEFQRKRRSDFSEQFIIKSAYRPFVKRFHYTEKIFNDVLTQNHYEFFGNKLNKENVIINFLCVISSHPLAALATDSLTDLCLLKSGNGGTQAVSLYRYDAAGVRHDNITDWALAQFRAHYGDAEISKTDIFAYTYAVLHHPVYRAKYALNLKRDFPRLPFYPNVRQWIAWGAALLDLHIGYETVAPYPLRLVADGGQIVEPRPKLKADKSLGVIVVDEATRLEGVPAMAWAYKLGNRSALEWILDQYKEKKPSDPTIAAKFHTYRLADYREQVIDLLRRVCAVSVATMEIVAALPAESET